MSDSLRDPRWVVGDLSEESQELDSYSAPSESSISTNLYRQRQQKIDGEVWRTRFIEFFEFSPIPFIILEHHDLISQINLAGCELLRKRLGEIIKTSFRSLFTTPAEIDLFIKDVLQISTASVMMTQLANGDRVRIHAIPFMENGQKIRIGMTKEIQNPYNSSRFRHVMLATKDAFCIYNSNGILSENNKSARLLLSEFSEHNFNDLLKHFQLSITLKDINRELEYKNIWRHPISLHEKPYLLVVSSIYCELANASELLLKITPLKSSQNVEIQENSRVIKAISQRASTPLTIVASAANLLRTLDPKSEEFEKILTLLEANAKVLNSLHFGLESLSRPRGFELKPTSLSSILRSVIQAVLKLNSNAKISLDIEDSPLFVWSDLQNAIRVLTSLILFASEVSTEIQLKLTKTTANTYLNLNFVNFQNKTLEFNLGTIRQTLLTIGAEAGQLNQTPTLNTIEIIFVTEA